MNPESIELSSISKLFEYEKIARGIDSIDEISFLRNIAKSYAKLYFKQQEILNNL